MGATIVDTGSKTHQSGNVWRMIGPFSEKPAIFCAGLWQHMKLLYPTGKITANAVETCWFSTTKQSKGNTVGQKVVATVFWDVKGILSTGQTITGQWYVNLLDQLQQKKRAKRPVLARKPSPWGQCTPADMCRCHGKNTRTEIRCCHTGLGLWYGSIRLPSSP